MSMAKIRMKKAVPLVKSTEADLAVHIVRYLDALGYTTYKEVSKWGGGSDRADIYAVSNNGTVSVETKTSFTIKVMEQAWQWVGHAHTVYVGVPAAKRRSERHFGYTLCAMLGIGVLEVDGVGNVHVAQAAMFNPAPKLPKLYEEQRESIAGNADNEYVTPYKLTARNVRGYMADKDRANIKDLIAGIKHHYTSPASARAALKNLIAMGVIEGLGMQGHNVVNLTRQKK